MKATALAVALILTSTPAFAQLGGALGKLGKVADQAQKIKATDLSDADERKIGEAVSVKVRGRYGVYQNAAVQKYVALVGTVLAKDSQRPDLKWEFIVLDTEAVNAFAAPGGIVHITRGALGLIKSEAELAGVLAHEVAHVAKKHTANAIEKNKRVKLGTEVAVGSREYLNAFVDATYDNIVERGFDRKDEEDADQEGVRLVAKAGYNPAGLTTFLMKLMERNKDVPDRNGLFASHPEAKGRIDDIGKQIKSEKLTAAATGTARYAKAITFGVKPISEIKVVSAGARALSPESKAPPTEAKKEPKKGGLKLSPGMLTKGRQAEDTQASASAGGRAVTPDRDAPGGGNPAKVAVTVTAAEVAAFKNGIA